MSAISKLSADSSSTSSTDDDFVATYQAMAELQAKLLALDYSKAFVSAYKCPPINRFYFCRPAGGGQQFFAFTCLASYLLNRLKDGGDFKVDSFDDPNLTIDRILNAAAAHVDISTWANARAKFKAGFGGEVIGLLSRLVDKVCLKELQTAERGGSSVTVRFFNADGSPVEEGEGEDGDELENIEGDEIELEEEFADYILDEEMMMGADGVYGGEDDGWDDEDPFGPQNQDEKDGNEKKAMITASTDLTEWKLELERILPQLNARLLGASMLGRGGGSSTTTAQDSTAEWRLHYAAATAQHATIKGVYGQTAALVGALSEEIRAALEKIDAKEAYLRSNCATILAEWATVRERAERLRTAFQAVEGEAAEKAARLAELGEEDRSTKQALEEYSLRMTDSSPLLEAKKAREALKAELVSVNLQIGVAIQTLVRHITLYTSPVY